MLFTALILAVRVASAPQTTGTLPSQPTAAGPPPAPARTCSYELIRDGTFELLDDIFRSGWTLTKSHEDLGCGLAEDGYDKATGQATDDGHAFYVYNPRVINSGFCTISQEVSVDAVSTASLVAHMLPRTGGADAFCSLTKPSGVTIPLVDSAPLAVGFWATVTAKPTLDDVGIYLIECQVTVSPGAGFRIDDVSLVADTGGPCPNFQDIGGFKYRGCKTEASKHRALRGDFTALDDLTLQTCATFCSDWPYFGVEYGRECWCGEYLHKTAKDAPERECNIPCLGDDSQLCGGSRRLSIYKNEDVVGPIQPPKISSLNGLSGFVGCYSESGRTGGFNRTLVGASFAADNMTLESCEAFCGIKGNALLGHPYKYWGVEYGRECYCGSDISTGAIVVDEWECEHIMCSGSKTQACGGHNRMAVYEFLGAVEAARRAKEAGLAGIQRTPAASLGGVDL